MKKQYYIFYDITSGKELCAITVEGTFIGEISDTIRLLSYEKGIDAKNISIKIENRDFFEEDRRKGNIINFTNVEHLKVKFFDKELYPEGLIPIDDKSDWIDLRAAEEVSLGLGDYYCIPLGVAIQLPKGYEALLIPRSSLFKNYGVIQTNSVGLIDETYCGDNDEWKLPVINLTKEVTIIHKGDRICQFRIQKHQPKLKVAYVDTLGNSDRGGLGSTGIN